MIPKYNSFLLFFKIKKKIVVYVLVNVIKYIYVISFFILIAN